MKYNKIRGRTIAECMMKLRSAYGADAIILETREVQEGGLLGSGLFSRKTYEIEYMLPERQLEAGEKHFANKPSSLNKNLNLISSNRRGQEEQDTYESTKQISSIAKRFSQTPLLHTNPLSLSKPISNSRTGLGEQLETLSSPQSISQGISQGQKIIEDKDLYKGENTHFLRIQEKLKVAQMSPQFASSFIKQLEEGLSPKEKEDYKKIEQHTLKVISQKIQVVPSKAPVRGDTRAFMLIGPTGSGKTTTLAKLAARFHLMEKRSVSLYSLDHYRLAATEQLKTYANVMGLDFKSPLNKAEFVEYLHRDGSEIILIDTSGISWGDEKRLEELRSYILACSNEIHLECNLVLATNTNPLLLEKILLAYDKVGFDKLLLTKIDEAKEFIGAYLEIADKFKRPFSFVTNGQEVPSDIHEANARQLASMVLGYQTVEGI